MLYVQHILSVRVHHINFETNIMTLIFLKKTLRSSRLFVFIEIKTSCRIFAFWYERLPSKVV